MKKVIGIIVAVIIIAAGAYYFYQQKENGKQQENTEKEVIKIGAILPLTGGASLPGNSLLNGLQLSNLNNDDNFKLIILDSKSEAKTGLLCYNQLINFNKCDILITALSSVTNSILPKNKNTPIFITLSSYPNITLQNKNAFRFFINSSDEVNLLKNYLFEKKVKSIGIIHFNDEGSLGVSEELKKQLSDNTFFIKFNKTVDINGIDFKNTITKIKNEDVDVIAIIGNGKVLGRLIKQVRANQIDLPIISTTPLGSMDAMNEAGDAIYNNVFYVSPFSQFNNNSLSIDFRNKYKKKYDREPDFIAGYAYDLGNIIYKLFDNSKKLQIDSLNFTDYKFDGVSGNIKINKNREISGKIVVVKKTKQNIKIVYPIKNEN